MEKEISLKRRKRMRKVKNVLINIGAILCLLIIVLLFAGCTYVNLTHWG